MCAQPEEPVGVNMLVEDIFVGGKVLFMCEADTPYTIGGDDELICGSDGEWIGEPLQCSCMYIILQWSFCKLYVFESCPVELQVS